MTTSMRAGLFDLFTSPRPSFGLKLMASSAWTTYSLPSLPLVLHGTCGVSMEDIARCAKAGMNKLNFGEGIRMNYIRYWQDLAENFPHEGHAWRIMREAKEQLKGDVKAIIQAAGASGRQ